MKVFISITIIIVLAKFARSNFPESANETVIKCFQERDSLSVLYISSLIAQGKFKLAHKELSKHSNPSAQISSIVKAVYVDTSDSSKRRYASTKKLLTFLSFNKGDLVREISLPGVSQLHDLRFKYPQDKVPPELLLIAENCLSSNCSKDLKSSEKGKESLRVLTLNLLQQWKNDIHDNNFEDIVKFCKSPRSVPALRRFLPEIVRNCYEGNVQNYQATEAFTQKVSKNELRAVSMKALMGEVNKCLAGHSPEMLQLGVTLKKFGSNEGKRFDGDQTTEDLYREMRLSLPGQFGKLIWGRECWIKSFLTGKFVYVGDTLTNTQMDDGVSEKGKMWQFHPWKRGDVAEGESDNKLYWLIKSVEWERDKQFLCIRKDTHNETNTVETCFKTGFNNKKRISSNWILQPAVKKDFNLFQIRTLEDSQQFYLWDEDGATLRAKVVQSSDNLDKSYWKIECE